jgi:hypothetical protein
MVARSGKLALACRTEYPKAPKGKSPDGKLRKTYEKSLNAGQGSFWRSDKIWEGWPDALLNSGVVQNRKLQSTAIMEPQPRLTGIVKIAVDCNRKRSSSVCNQLQMRGSGVAERGGED